MTRRTIGRSYSDDAGSRVEGRSMREGRSQRRPKKRNYSKEKTTRLERFCLDFAAELDLFDSDMAVPDWVFGYRDKLIGKLGPELCKICLALKSRGLRFKIKWPVEIDGKWKFADVYFPRQKTVLMVTNARAMAGLPNWSLSNRAMFFHGRYRVVEVETLDELLRKIERKAQTA